MYVKTNISSTDFVSNISHRQRAIELNEMKVSLSKSDDSKHPPTNIPVLTLFFIYKKVLAYIPDHLVPVSNILSVRVKAKLFGRVKFFCAVPQGPVLRVFSLYRKWSLIKYFWLLQGRPIDACRTPQKDPLRHTLTLNLK